MTNPRTAASNAGTLAPAVSPPGPWAQQALCASIPDPDIFFPPHGNPGNMARQICRNCPVTAACLTYAVENNERFGIWGGLDPDERALLRRKLRRPASKPRRGAA